jgi:hypothetical protein
LRLSIKTGIFKKIFKAILKPRIHSKQWIRGFLFRGKGGVKYFEKKSAIQLSEDFEIYPKIESLFI